MLLAVGGDGSGDVRITPAGEHPASPPAKAQLQSTPFPHFAALRAHAGPIDRVAIAGFQDKVSADDANGAAHILNLQEPRFPHLVENEAFFLALARHAGIVTTNYAVITDGVGETALLVERFDRVNGARLAFEDASQVLGIRPEQKYHVPAEEAYLALIAHCTDKHHAAATLFQQVAFAVITGNGDQHAKNLGILQEPTGEWRVSGA